MAKILTRLESRYYLHARRTVTYHRNDLVLVIEMLGPVCAVHKVALEVVEAGDVGPFPVAEKPRLA